jgi:hypothetical protein
VKDPRAEGDQPGDTRNRRRNGFVGSIVIGVVALSVIVVPHFISSSPVSNDDSDPTNGSHHVDAVDPSASPCPTQPIEVTRQTSDGLQVSAGAVSIRVCTADWHGVPSSGIAPSDALTAGLSSFYRAAAELPPPPEICSTLYPAAAPVAIVVRYEDRQDVLAVRDLHCVDVLVDGEQHDLGAVLNVVADALRDQRQQLPAH